MDEKEKIKDKTKRLIYYLAIKGKISNNPLHILEELKEMSKEEMKILEEKKKILSELISEEKETGYLRKLVEHYRKNSL